MIYVVYCLSSLMHEVLMLMIIGFRRRNVPVMFSSCLVDSNVCYLSHRAAGDCLYN